MVFLNVFFFWNLEKKFNKRPAQFDISLNVQKFIHFLLRNRYTNTDANTDTEHVSPCEKMSEVL